MKIIPDKPALLLKNKIVIADLHLGLFSHFDTQLIKETSKLLELGEELIVLGDLKHLGRKGKVEEFINSIGDFTLVRGNHDVNVPISSESSRGIKIGKYGLFHGHAMPSDDVLQAKKLIVAHAHPSVFLPDNVGGVKERVWLNGEIEIDGERKEILVMPAFNELCASTAVNLEKPAGVIFKRWNYNKAKVILLDGTLLSLNCLL